MIQKRLLLLVPAAVVFAAALSGTAAVVGDAQDSTNSSCTRTAVDLSSADGDSNSVDIVVLVSASSSTSVSQQISQFDSRVEVDIDVGYDDGTVAISGESIENGSLELEVTHNDTVVNESLVVNGSDDRALVFHIDSNRDINISREEDPDKCLCETGTTESEVRIDGDDSDDPYETDGGRNVDCSESDSCTCSDSSTELSPSPDRSSATPGPQRNVMRVVTHSPELVGLAKPGRVFDCGGQSVESPADCPSEP